MLSEAFWTPNIASFDEYFQLGSRRKKSGPSLLPPPLPAVDDPEGVHPSDTSPSAVASGAVACSGSLRHQLQRQCSWTTTLTSLADGSTNATASSPSDCGDVDITDDSTPALPDCRDATISFPPTRADLNVDAIISTITSFLRQRYLNIDAITSTTSSPPTALTFTTATSSPSDAVAATSAQLSLTAMTSLPLRRHTSDQLSLSPTAGNDDTTTANTAVPTSPFTTARWPRQRWRRVDVSTSSLDSNDDVDATEDGHSAAAQPLSPTAAWRHRHHC